MANTYYSVNTSTPIADVSAALTDKYGAGVTIHYETANYLVFTCAAITNKVIKLYYYSGSWFGFFYGDAWTSGTTITNQVQFGGYGSGTATAIHLVLGTSFFFLCYLMSNTPYSGVVIIGELTNGNHVAVGLMGDATYAGYYCKARDTVTGIDLRLITISHTLCDTTNKLYKQPVILATAAGVAEMNGNSFATISGLYNISYRTSNNTLIKGPNSLMSPSLLFANDSVQLLQTCLFAEW